jgi:Spy/CpxP family protein refolding chaperone
MNVTLIPRKFVYLETRKSNKSNSSMKINTLTLALAISSLLAFTSSLPAQSNNPPAAATPRGAGAGRMSVEARLENLSKQLNLTEDQKPKVKAVLEDQQKKFAELRNAAPEERRAAREEMNAKMKAILTPEQFTKYEAMPRGPGRRSQGGDTNSAAGAAKPEAQK